MKDISYIVILSLVIAIGYVLITTEDTIEYTSPIPPPVVVEEPLGSLKQSTPIKVGTKEYASRLAYRLDLLDKTAKMTAHVNEISEMRFEELREWFELANNETTECGWGEVEFTKDSGLPLDTSNEEDIEMILRTINTRMIASCDPITKVTR